MADDAAVAARFEQARVLHQQGQMQRAVALYVEVLKEQPEHFEALRLLGILAGQQGQAQTALELFTRALAVNPAHASTHSNRGNALLALKRLDEALASCERAVALDPASVEALYNHGVVLKALGRPAEALASFDRALALRPDFAEALNARGNMLRDLGRKAEARASYAQALVIRPAFAEAANNLGLTLRELGLPAEALAACDRALAVRPDFPEALLNRAHALLMLKRTTEALASYDSALAIRPDYAEALNYRGVALQIQRRREEALASFDRAVALRPDYVEALTNQGALRLTLRRMDEAQDSFRRALAIDPGYPYLFGSWLNAKLSVCDWSGLAAAAAELAAGIDAGRRVAAPFAILGAAVSRQRQRRCAEIYVQDRHPPVPAAAVRVQAHDRIRLGYFSADLHNHPTAYLMAELFERHDRTKFELHAFSFGPAVASAMRSRLAAAFDTFTDVREKSDADIALLARSMEIDIAVDLKGFTEDSRTDIFARRAAPIQVNYLGYPGTMGADYIDYLIADRTLVPDDHVDGYAEKIVCLPDSYQPNDTQRVIADRQFTRREAGLPEQGFVFCCFNNNWKIAPDMFGIWLRLLKQVEGSVLWLLEDNAAAARNLRREAGLQGVGVERLVFAPRLPLAEHLARHRLADLFLDTLPCNAHTTASDALWAGLPVLTCPGETFAGRVGASLVRAVGLPELVAGSRADYEALALRLATGGAELQALRQRLAANRLVSPLFDSALYTRHLETAFALMWERHQAGQPAAHIVVPR